MPARAWRFNSSLAHNDVWLDDYVKSLLTRTFVLGSCGPWWTEVAPRGHSFPTYSPRKPPRGEWVRHSAPENGRCWTTRRALGLARGSPATPCSATSSSTTWERGLVMGRRRSSRISHSPRTGPDGDGTRLNPTSSMAYRPRPRPLPALQTHRHTICRTGATGVYGLRLEGLRRGSAGRAPAVEPVTWQAKDRALVLTRE